MGVEVEVDNAKLATKNNLNNNNVKILHCAIGSERGLVNIENPEASKDSFRTNSNIIPGKDSIKMITISDIESEFPEAIPFVVKIDIEGFEDSLFSKNTEWMSKFYLITLEIHDYMLPKKAISKNFFREHSKDSRDCYLMGDMVFSIKN